MIRYRNQDETNSRSSLANSESSSTTAPTSNKSRNHPQAAFSLTTLMPQAGSSSRSAPMSPTTIPSRGTSKGRKSTIRKSLPLVSFLLFCYGITFVLERESFTNVTLTSIQNLDIEGLYKQQQVRLRTDQPPSNLFVRGKRDHYTPCPAEYCKKAFIDLIEDQNLHRAFKYNGWLVSTESEDFTSGKCQVLYKKKGKNKPKTFEMGQPWQRFSRLPGFYELESKDSFLAGFRKFSTKPKDIYFLPETYRLSLEEDRKAFQQTIARDNAKGRNRPWVLRKAKLNNGKGVEILPPNSPALYNAVDKSVEDKSTAYVAQAYVCNELTWFGGEKFDLRFFWFVASVDPLIVLYQDGYVRVGGSLYNETDFQSSGQHLTNHAFRKDVDDRVTAEDLWRLVRNHYDRDSERLSKLIVGNDPVQHVRNQIKEAISTMAEAFRDTLTLTGPDANKKVTFENLFGFFGADFIIDQDLDVFFIEAQVSPGMGQSQDFRIDVFRRLFRPMVNLIEEIAIKQATNATANLFPLQNMDDYELVYVGGGGPGSDHWRYRYRGYQRSKRKTGCSLPAKTIELPH